MKRRDVKGFILASMPPGEWVNIEWAESLVRAKFGSGTTPPAKLLNHLVSEKQIVSQRINKRHNRLITEFRRPSV